HKPAAEGAASSASSSEVEQVTPTVEGGLTPLRTTPQRPSAGDQPPWPASPACVAGARCDMACSVSEHMFDDNRLHLPATLTERDHGWAGTHSAAIGFCRCCDTHARLLPLRLQLQQRRQQAAH